MVFAGRQIARLWLRIFEDIVQGKASETDCMFKLRERISDLAQKMAELAQKPPPSLRIPLDDGEDNLSNKNSD